MLEVKNLSTTETISNYDKNYLNSVSFIIQNNDNKIIKVEGSGLYSAILGNRSISGSIIERLSTAETKINILSSYESNAANSAATATSKASEAASFAASAEQSAIEAANSANIVNNAALKDSDNIFVSTNTFNSVVTFNENIIKTSEIWGSNQIPSIGVTDVLNYFSTLNSCKCFTPRGNPLDQKVLATAYADTTTNTIATKPLGWGWGGTGSWTRAKYIRNSTALTAGPLVNGWFKISNGAMYNFLLSAGESIPAWTAAFPEHNWALVSTYKNHHTQDIQILCPKSAKNQETIVLYKEYCPYTTTAEWTDPSTVDFYLEIPCVWLYDAMNAVQSLNITVSGNNSAQRYISIMGDTNLSAWKKLPKWVDSYIASQIKVGEYNYAYVSNQGIAYSKGPQSTLDNVTIKCSLYEYGNSYTPSDPENCLKFNIKNQTSKKGESYDSGVRWNQKEVMGVHMVPYRIVSDMLIENPTTEDLIWEEHSNIDRIHFPAAGGYLYIRYKADYTDSGYYRYLMEPTHENIEVVDEWMPYGNLWCQGSMDTNTWVSRELTYRGERHTELHAWAAPKRWRYAYVQIPENTSTQQRDTWVFAGLTGFEGIVYRIIQDGVIEEVTEETN